MRNQNDKQIVNKSFKKVFTKKEGVFKELILQDSNGGARNIDTIEKINVREAPGPDEILKLMMRDCREQLADKIQILIQNLLKDRRVQYLDVLSSQNITLALGWERSVS